MITRAQGTVEDVHQACLNADIDGIREKVADIFGHFENGNELEVFGGQPVERHGQVSDSDSETLDFCVMKESSGLLENIVIQKGPGEFLAVSAERPNGAAVYYEFENGVCKAEPHEAGMALASIVFELLRKVELDCTIPF